jgi:hypothetical protein
MLIARVVDQRLDPLGRRQHLALGAERGPADDEVEQEVAGEDEHVPEHDRVRRGMEEDVEHAQRLPHVHDDEGHAHRHGGDGEELPEDDDPVELLVVVEVVGDDEHHGGCRHADEEGELADVQAPGHVPAHAGDPESQLELSQVEERAHRDEAGEHDDPAPVPAAPRKRLLHHGRSSSQAMT